jgi:hypothetical protein
MPTKDTAATDLRPHLFVVPVRERCSGTNGRGAVFIRGGIVATVRLVAGRGAAWLAR